MAAQKSPKNELIAGLEAAVQTAPDNVDLRMLLIGHLMDEGLATDALAHAEAILRAHPAHAAANRAAAAAAAATGDPRAGAFAQLASALEAAPTAAPVVPHPAPPPAPAASDPAPASPQAAPSRPAPAQPAQRPAPAASADALPAPAPQAAASPAVEAPPRPRGSALRAANATAFEHIESVDDTLVADISFEDSDDDGLPPLPPISALPDVEDLPPVPEPAPQAAPVADAPASANGEVWERPDERFTVAADDIERPTLSLADIPAEDVRDRLEAVVVNPLRHGGGARKGTQGGIVLFGPDGCGKRFFGRIVAGELKAAFLPVDLAESMQWPGDPRQNVETIFRAAQDVLPCVLFLDNLDRVGIHPDTPEAPADRRVLSRLASEITGAASHRGLYIFGGTSAPWDIDMTLMSDGRLDRAMVVLPPTDEARESILRRAMGDTKVSGLDIAWIIERTRHFSVDDLLNLIDRAKALAAANALGDDVVVGPGEMTRAFREVRPSAPAWFSRIHEHATSGKDGIYDEVLTYIRANQLA